MRSMLTWTCRPITQGVQHLVIHLIFIINRHPKGFSQATHVMMNAVWANCNNTVESERNTSWIVLNKITTLSTK